MQEIHPVAPAASAPPRSKIELLYQEILRESHVFISRLEQVSRQQEEIQNSLQALPMTIRQAGLDAANQTADQASRSLLEAARTIATATSELRIASRAATSAHSATAWRAGMLCLAGAFGGSAFCAALIVLFKYL
ncbi:MULTISPECIES: hypothetical protein [Achromobacter]|uniref:Uncharacterized protein n=1 Tax=Achromobacter spanius TaxID=217203 RepID=A0AA42IU94_9BURK|nr:MULTISPECIES: hypothetical protein [Achromobacter]MDH0734827.1 hypothetical protein [Achromobacter spanius]